MREFSERVDAVLVRYLAQQGVTVTEARAARFGRGLADLVRRRGLSDAEGTGGGPVWRDEELVPLAGELIEQDDPAAVGEAARQLVKACFYPELAVCRDSFRAMGADGLCRRQELARVRMRVSGSHCVDCPHWLALAGEEHRALLETAWRGSPAEWRESREIFLPEDFRALRQCLRTLARDHK